MHSTLWIAGSLERKTSPQPRLVFFQGLTLSLFQSGQSNLPTQNKKYEDVSEHRVKDSPEVISPGDKVSI